MEKFQITVTPVPGFPLWEVEILGVGVTQSTSPNDADVEVMARDYLDAMGRNADAILEITHTEAGQESRAKREPGSSV